MSGAGCVVGHFPWLCKYVFHANADLPGVGCESDGGIGLAVDSWYREMLASMVFVVGGVFLSRVFPGLLPGRCQVVRCPVVRCQVVRCQLVM